jgi:hypothetical protein
MAMRQCATACAIAATITACGEPAEGRYPQEIEGWSWNGGATVSVVVPTCDGNPDAVVEEMSETVIVTVTSTRTNPCNGDFDQLTVTLDSPLEGRTVIDGTTAREAPGMEG